jgi:hypothetical protein
MARSTASQCLRERSCPAVAERGLVAGSTSDYALVGTNGGLDGDVELEGGVAVELLAADTAEVRVGRAVVTSGSSPMTLGWISSPVEPSWLTTITRTTSRLAAAPTTGTTTAREPRVRR